MVGGAWRGCPSEQNIFAQHSEKKNTVLPSTDIPPDCTSAMMAPYLNMNISSMFRVIPIMKPSSRRRKEGYVIATSLEYDEQSILFKTSRPHQLFLRANTSSKETLFMAVPAGLLFIVFTVTSYEYFF